MLPAGRYEPARGSEEIQCWLIFSVAAGIGLWGLASEDPQFYHYALPPLGIVIALSRLRGWIPSQKGKEGETGTAAEYEASRHEPAEGFEKILCYGLIGMALVVLLVSLISGSTSWINLVASGVMILVGTARLKGWVRRGGGGGVGGGP